MMVFANAFSNFTSHSTCPHIRLLLWSDNVASEPEVRSPPPTSSIVILKHDYSILFKEKMEMAGDDVSVLIKSPENELLEESCQHVNHKMGQKIVLKKTSITIINNVFVKTGSGPAEKGSDVSVVKVTKGAGSICWTQILQKYCRVWDLSFQKLENIMLHITWVLPEEVEDLVLTPPYNTHRFASRPKSKCGMYLNK